MRESMERSNRTCCSGPHGLNLNKKTCSLGIQGPIHHIEKVKCRFLPKFLEYCLICWQLVEPHKVRIYVMLLAAFFCCWLSILAPKLTLNTCQTSKLEEEVKFERELNKPCPPKLAFKSIITSQYYFSHILKACLPLYSVYSS